MFDASSGPRNPDGWSHLLDVSLHHSVKFCFQRQLIPAQSMKRGPMAMPQRFVSLEPHVIASAFTLSSREQAWLGAYSSGRWVRGPTVGGAESPFPRHVGPAAMQTLHHLIWIPSVQCSNNGTV